MRNEKTIPMKEELEQLKVKLKEKKTGETFIYGWPQEPPNVATGEFVKYRIARALMGYTTASGRKVKRYGIHLLIGLVIISIFITGASKTPYFFDAVGTFVAFFIFGFVWFTVVYLKPTYVPIIQELRKGEEVPIAMQDDNGKVKIITVKAEETITNVFRIERESLDYLIPFGVIEEQSANHTPVWRIKHYHYNMVWGAALYESYDTTHLDSWGQIVSWTPSDVDAIIKRTERYLKKDQIPEDEIKFVQEKIHEIYQAMQLIELNEGELNTRYGRRLVKIKRTRSNRTFLMAWKEIVQDIEAYHLKRLETRTAANEQEEQIIKLINRAKKVELERSYDQLMMKEREKIAMDTGYLMRDLQFHTSDTLAHEQDTAARASDLRETEDIARRAIDRNIEKQIQEGMEDGETN